MDSGLKDFRLILWNIPAEQMPNDPAGVSVLNIDQSSNPALVGLLNDGWEIVNHTITPLDDGGVMLSLFLQCDIRIPDGV